MFIKSLSFKILSILSLLLILGYFFFPSKESLSKDEIAHAKVKKQSFSIDIRTIGELEASESISIASQIRSDNGKIISLIPDGTNVQIGDILVKLDPTPFEEKVENLKTKFKEQEGYVAALKKSLDWEISQAVKDEKTAVFEIESAELELNKILQGDGPLECARLKSARNKALSKYEEFHGYCNDLEALESEGFLNPVEISNAGKKLLEEKENYEAAKLQYESYVNYVYPMQVKKAEATVKQALMKQEESGKIRGHAIGKAKLEVDQAYQNTLIGKQQWHAAEKELALTTITALSPGMVVHREDFRNGQRRKPRIGDVLIRNQVILDLPDLNDMTVKTKVREVDLCHVEIGKNASIEIDAYPQLKLTGEISSIGILALADSGKPTDEKYFEIRVHLNESDPKVRPGMTTRLVIHSSKVDDVIAIPVHALFYETGKSFCYVELPDRMEKREVLAGLSNEEWVEIRAGLNEGESVCLSAPKNLL